LIFAIALGALNTLIYPVLRAVDQPITVGRIAAGSCGISWVAYIICKFASIGIEISSIEGFFLASSVAALSGFLTNLFEMRRSGKMLKPPEMPRL
jgi:hypothetical protein